MNFKQDIQSFLKKTGWAQLRLSRESGVNKDTLNRFLNGKIMSLKSTDIERLSPYIYGGKSPSKKNDEDEP